MSRGLSFLEWVDHHPDSYFWLVSGLIVLALILATGPLWKGRYDDTPGHDWWWGLLILAILAAGRWPSLLYSREIGVDESQLLAGAHALTRDPVFWRSVIGGTAGPLDFFALWPAGWICGWDTYLTARLTALALLAASLILAHQSMALVWGRPIARLAGLVAVTLESLTCAMDFLHYSTELVPLTLLSVAAYAAVQRWATRGGPGWNALGGLMLGAVPLAKLQGVPLAAAMGLCWVWAELRAGEKSTARHRACLIAGALFPAALLASQLTVAGEWQGFIISYVSFNFHYAAAGQATYGRTLLVMLGAARWRDPLLLLGLVGLLGWLTLMLRLHRVPPRTTRLLGWAAFAAGLIAFGSIIAPMRPYLHYWQLLLVPSVFFLGAMIARLLTTSPPPWRRREQWLVALGALAAVGLMLQHRARNPNPFVGHLAFFGRSPRTVLADHVAGRARPGEAMVLWGRADNLYVETGLRQATRYSEITSLVEAGPLQEYARAHYLADFRRNKPELFVDVTCPAAFQFKTPEYAHERNFPALAAAVSADYVLVEEFAQARIYRRKDLAGR
jgi:hypothetical protein